MRRYAVVRAAWDEEAKVWFVEEPDIPGLATEAEMLDALRRKVPGLIKDHLERAADRQDEIAIDFIACAHDRVRLEELPKASQPSGASRAPVRNDT